MDLETLREWLIQNGVSEQELNNIEVPPVLNDLANYLKITLENNDELGSLIVNLLVEIENLKRRIEVLENA
jgi:hypothetical protein